MEKIVRHRVLRIVGMDPQAPPLASVLLDPVTYDTGKTVEKIVDVPSANGGAPVKVKRRLRVTDTIDPPSHGDAILMAAMVKHIHYCEDRGIPVPNFTDEIEENGELPLDTITAAVAAEESAHA